MILVDTSIWVDHLNKTVPELVKLLNSTMVCTHPFIIGELSCGNILNRTEILTLIKSLPRIEPAFEEEVNTLIENKNLYGIGLGFIDIHILASALINDVKIWTNDKVLKKTAQKLNIDK
jgi:predicted nucleic acid-binding protein